MILYARRHSRGARVGGFVRLLCGRAKLWNWKSGLKYLESRRSHVPGGRVFAVITGVAWGERLDDKR
jgi:hypothetical protein